MNCLLDTGSSLSVIHPSIYARMTGNKPELTQTGSQLKMADGGLVNVVGKATFQLNIGNCTYKQLMAVADIEAPAVLGYDFMKSQNCQIDVARGEVSLNGVTEKCILESTLPKVYRIRVAENTVIPQSTEMIIPAVVEGSLPYTTRGVIHAGELTDTRGILVAKTIVDPCNEVVPVRVANLSGQAQTLYAHSHIATCHAVDLLQEASSGDTLRVENGHTELPHHIKQIWDDCQELLDTDQRSRVKELLLNHESVFAVNKEDLGRTGVVKHKINTGDAPPVKQHPRRLPLAKRELVKEELTKMLQQGIIEPSQSPWSSPIVLVQKKDGSTRFCVDYRKLNSLTYKDSYPLPRVDESIDTLRGSKWFTTLDLQSGYFQVEMDPKDAEKTAFTTMCGLYQFKVMSFGLCNAPATFERMMEAVLAGLHWETCLLYIDDIIVFADSFEQHIHRLSEVLTRLENAGLKLSPSKCKLFRKSVGFLGHIVSEDGVSTDPTKIDVVQQWPTPRSVHDVRSFLGLCSYYRRFVKGFATIAKPLHRLTEKQTPFSWTDECQSSFDTLKQALTTSPVLCYPSIRENFILDTDASGVGIGAVLSQVNDGCEKVVAYYSKALTKAQRNFCITRKELLAVVEAVKHFHHYIYGVPTLVRTDHGALTWLLSFKNIEGQMARWMEALGTYDLTIQYRAGRKHMNADSLSRLPCDHCDYCSRQEAKDTQKQVNDSLDKLSGNSESVRAITRSQDKAVLSVPIQQGPQAEANTDESQEACDMERAQQSDSVLSVVYGWLVEKARPEWKAISHLGSEFKRYWALWDSLIIRDRLVYRIKFGASETENTYQLLVPRSKVSEAIRRLHNDITAGHMGINRTIARIKERFHWFNLKDNVQEWCRSCEECQKAKNDDRKPKAPLGSVKVGEPFECIALDILGPLPQTRQGNKYILVIADYFSRWTESFALSNITSETVTNVLVNEVICRFGLPMRIHTDQGRQFEADMFQQMCLLFDIDKTRTTAYHPQSNGLVERFNRTLLRMMTKFVSADQRDWDEKLPFIMMAYRSSQHETTGFSPNCMMFGREMTMPIDLLYGPPPESKEQTECEFVQTLRNKLANVHASAREKMVKAADKQKKTYDHRLHVNIYKRGDLVWQQNRSKRAVSPKLQFGWEGPYTVLARLTDLVYRIQKNNKSEPRIVHHNVLKPYHGDAKSWLLSDISI
ncbi:MAG: reverse transcriptase domain-containing protein [Sedimenticola sp.]